MLSIYALCTHIYAILYQIYAVFSPHICTFFYAFILYMHICSDCSAHMQLVTAYMQYFTAYMKFFAAYMQFFTAYMWYVTQKLAYITAYMRPRPHICIRKKPRMYDMPFVYDSYVLHICRIYDFFHGKHSFIKEIYGHADELLNVAYLGCEFSFSNSIFIETVISKSTVFHGK